MAISSARPDERSAGPHAGIGRQRPGRRCISHSSTGCLNTPFATFIGLYSNVPEHGQLDPDQRTWFREQMAAADKNKALIVAVHHPIYSFDTYHSGSPTMAKELEDAINESGRLPNMVLNAHVHNYQRIELSVAGHTIPFFVIGNGGYWNLHHLGRGAGLHGSGNRGKTDLRDRQPARVHDLRNQREGDQRAFHDGAPAAGVLDRCAGLQRQLRCIQLQRRTIVPAGRAER